MGTRDRIARILARTGATTLALRARALARVPYLSILTYHHVHAPGADYRFDPGAADVTPDQFARHLDLLARRFTVIGIDELCAALDGAPLPPNAAMITFDDGYRSCHDVALPLLVERGLRAVFFIPTWYVDERRLFWWERIHYLAHHDRRIDPGARIAEVKNTRGLDLDRFFAALHAQTGVPWDDAIERRLVDELLMSWDHIRTLARAGMDIESHTRKHRVLQTLDHAELDSELAGSRADLERAVGRAPRTVAYPVGRPILDDSAIRDAVARAGYRAGFTNASGATWLGPFARDPFDLGRVAVDRELGDGLFAGQLAFPALAFRARTSASKSTR